MFDVIALLALITVRVSQNMHADVAFMYPKLENGIVMFITLLVYILHLILAQMLPNAHKCFTKSKVSLLKRMNRYQAGMINEVQAFFTDEVNYNACQ